MTAAWAHLPNAAHIDRILSHLRDHPDRWGAARDAARDAAWGATRGAAWDAARDAARAETWAEAWDAARDAAWDAARAEAWDAAREVQADLLRIVCAEGEQGEKHEIPS